MPDVTLAGLSILVVEDERLLCKQITAHLEKLDADVTGANTVQAAKRFLADLDFDLVLLDVNLPDGRGTDLLKERIFPANTGGASRRNKSFSSANRSLTWKATCKRSSRRTIECRTDCRPC